MEIGIAQLSKSIVSRKLKGHISSTSCERLILLQDIIGILITSRKILEVKTLRHWQSELFHVSNKSIVSAANPGFLLHRSGCYVVPC